MFYLIFPLNTTGFPQPLTSTWLINLYFHKHNIPKHFLPELSNSLLRLLLSNPFLTLQEEALLKLELWRQAFSPAGPVLSSTSEAWVSHLPLAPQSNCLRTQTLAGSGQPDWAPAIGWDTGLQFSGPSQGHGADLGSEPMDEFLYDLFI